MEGEKRGNCLLFHNGQKHQDRATIPPTKHHTINRNVVFFAISRLESSIAMIISSSSLFMFSSWLLLAIASGFIAPTVPASPRGHARKRTSYSPVSALYSGPPNQQEGGEEEGLDLDLEEMFDMFDAADKEENFDDALKKVKGGE